jgi:hypothetical protein
MRKKLETMKLGSHKNNVDDMCTEIEELMEKIEGAGEKCESIRRYTLTALMSGPNAKFNQFIDRIQDDIESGTGVHCNMTWQQIVETSRTKFQNMDSVGSWTWVDPPDARFIALTTKIDALEKQLSNKNENSRNWNGGNGDAPYSIEEWRFAKDGDTKKAEGKLWWWCTEHCNGRGMYVRHPPNEHDLWAERKRAGQKYLPPDYRGDYKSDDGIQKPPPSNDRKPPPSNSSPEESQSKRLKINDRLKTILCTNLCLSEQDADKLLKQAED